MAAKLIKVPSFEFSAFYYGQILDALITFKRENVPELTDESEFEPFIQFLRAVALVGHLNNVLIDMIANECTLPTAQLPETVRNMLRLITFELRPATPATADVVFQLSRVFNIATTVVPALGQMATKQVGTTPAIFFECVNQLDVERTDLVTVAQTYHPITLAYTDITASANTDGGPGVNLWLPEQAGCILYVGHSGIMWDKMSLEITDDSTGPEDLITIEYFDGDFQDVYPDNITNLGGGLLQFEVTSLLGTNNRAGAVVRVQLHQTGTHQDVVSTWNGVKNVATVGLLGQSSPSTVVTDYGVGAEWRELDTTLTKVGSDSIFSWVLPQSDMSDWKTTQINGITAFYVRLRIVSIVGSPTNSNMFGRIRIDMGKQYAKGLVTQGKSVIAETLGSSTGAPGQRFAVSQDSFILNSQTVFVDQDKWTPVLQMLSSGTQDKNYRVELGENDRASFVFGDGKNGAIPAVGQSNMTVNYRYGAIENGDVGSLSITVDKTGLSYVEKLWNPRKATGWSEAQSATDEGLALAKQEGPAALRTKDVALGPDDLVEMTLSLVDDNGANPYKRAVAVEEGFGPKTVELIVVPRGGGPASSIQLEALALYFNGDKTSIPPKRKRLVANQQVVPTNYKQRLVDISATVYAPAEVLPQQVINQLSLVLQPEALQEDGITYLWQFGAEIADSFIKHEIHAADPRITKVTLNGFVNILLTARELPSVGVLNIVIVQS